MEPIYFWPIKKSTNKQHKQQNMQTTICTFYPKIQFSIQNYVFCPYKTYQNFQSTLSMWGLSSNENVVRTWDFYQLFAFPLTMQWWIGFKCTLWVPFMIKTWIYDHFSIVLKPTIEGFGWKWKTIQWRFTLSKWKLQIYVPTQSKSQCTRFMVFQI